MEFACYIHNDIVSIVHDFSCLLIGFPPFSWSQSDESYILPVLLRFDGQPEIDEEVCSNKLCTFQSFFFLWN